MEDLIEMDGIGIGIQGDNGIRILVGVRNVWKVGNGTHINVDDMDIVRIWIRIHIILVTIIDIVKDDNV